MKTPIIFKSLNVVCKHNTLRNVKRDNRRRENTATIKRTSLSYLLKDEDEDEPVMAEFKELKNLDLGNKLKTVRFLFYTVAGEKNGHS